MVKMQIPFHRGGSLGGRHKMRSCNLVMCVVMSSNFTALIGLLYWTLPPAGPYQGGEHLMDVNSLQSEHMIRRGTQKEVFGSPISRSDLMSRGRNFTATQRHVGGKNVVDCQRSNYPASWELRADQVTILINGYSEERLPLIQRNVQAYSAASVVRSVYILWGNTSTSSSVLSQTLFTSLGASIYIVRQKSASLNDRFLPRSYIETRAVIICDDDISIDPKDIGFALNVWIENQDRIVGFFPRSHGYQLESRSWMYNKHEGKYSIMLTKMMVIATEFLFLYTCELPIGVKEYVDEGMNCEDIAMNFVVSSRTGKGPLLVEGKPMDWGDNRNLVENSSRIGLSARGGHMRDRGDCITAFQIFWNGIQLRYSYTKVVHNLENQVFCGKFGYVVECDSHVRSRRDAKRLMGQNRVASIQRYAYASFLPSDSFLNASLVLAQSLRSSGTIHDIVLLVDPFCTGSLKSSIIREHFDLVVPVQVGKNGDSWNQLGKLSAWLLEDYSKVVFIEIDSLVLANLDHLFELPEPSAAPRFFMPGKFSTGLLVLKPSNKTYVELASVLEGIHFTARKSKQYLINSVFGSWYQMPPVHRLPARYNVPLIFSKHFTFPKWLNISQVLQLMEPLMVVRYQTSKLGPRFFEAHTKTKSVWFHVWLNVFKALERNNFHPLDSEVLPLQSLLPITMSSINELTWPKKSPLDPVSLQFGLEKPAREAFVTMVWEDKVPYLIGWAESYHYHHSFHSRCKTILLVLSGLNISQYAPYFDIVKVIDPIIVDGRTVHSSSNLLHLWNQTEFDKLVYVESNALFVDNCKSLLDHLPFAAVPGVFPPDSFATDVMVLQPSLNTFKILLKTLGSYEHPEQPIHRLLNLYYSNWYQQSTLYRISPSFSVNMAFENHFQLSIQPRRILTFTSDWLPRERTNVERYWTTVLCKISEPKQPANLIPLCAEAVTDD